MAEVKTRPLVLFVVGSVAVVGLSIFFLWDSEPAEPTLVAADASLAQGSQSVRGASIDTARVRPPDEDEPGGGDLPVIDPEPAPQVEPERPPREAPPPAEPPIVPTDAALAEAPALLAARERAKVEVEGVVESRRTAIRNACWNGSKGASATFPIQASFGADGGLLALSVSDDRSAPEVAACVRAQPMPLKIDPPGVGVTVDVPLTLP